MRTRDPKSAIPLLLMLAFLRLEACSPSTPDSDSADPATSAEGVAAPSADQAHVPVFGYRIVHTYPHDPQAFTQGLLWADGQLFEGTGLYGQSGIRRVDLETGEVQQLRRLDDRYFGEGIARVGTRLLQLTWRSRVGFVYDLGSFQPLASFQYAGEGWGLTYDGRRLIRSNGTSVLTYLDPRTLEVSGQIHVHDSGGPVKALNELEWVAGEIYANVWQTDRIARISPYDGRVTGWIDLAGLLPARAAVRPVDVLNGIAYDAATERLFVTGKLWPLLFQIQLVAP